MNKIFKKIIKYIVVVFMFIALILPSLPVGGFDLLQSRISNRKVVDQQWLSKNSKSLVDVMGVNTAEGATNPIVGFFSPSATWTYVTNANLNLRQPDPRDGDLMIATIAIRPAASTVNTPGGWTLVDSRTGTDGGAENSDTGSVGYYVFSKVADGTEGTANQTFTENGTTSVWGGYISKVRSATGTYDVSASGYSINGDATNWNGTLGSDIGLTAGDLVLIGAATNGNLSAHSAQNISATGISAKGTAREHIESASGSGNDIEQTLSTVHIWTGTNSATPTITYTQSVASSGTVTAVRIRQGSGTRRTDTWVRSAGAQIAGTTSVSVPYPEHDVGDRLILFVANRYTTATPSTPANWTLISNSFTGGTGTNTTDSGTARMSAYYRDVSTQLTGTQSVTVTSGNTSIGQMVAIHKDDVDTWAMDVDGGSDTTGNNSWSTTGTSIDLDSSDGGDLVLVGSSINTDLRTYTAHALSATGITFGEVTETGEFRSSSGADMAFNLTTGRVTAGSDTGLALTHTKTANGSTTAAPMGADMYLAIKGTAPAGSINISGTANGNDAGIVKVAINGSVQAETGTISSGTWTITDVTAPSADNIVTVWVDNVSDANESTAVTKYSTGDITGMVLNTNVLTIGSSQNTSVSTTNLGLCDFDTGCSDEDIMHTSNSGALTVQGSSNSYTGETLSILASNTLTVASASSESITTEFINNAGIITATGTPTISLAGTSGTLFINSGTFTAGSSTTNLTGNGSAIVSSGSPTFYNLTSSGTGTKTLGAGLTLSSGGTLNILNGVFDPSTYLVTGSGTNTLSVASGATIRVNTSTFSDNYSAGFTSRTLSSGSTVDYFLNGAQAIDSSVTYSGLTLSSGGTKTFSGGITANGDFTNNSSVTISTGNNSLSLGGNFTNSGVALNAGSSAINITGTGTQSIAGYTTTGTTTMSKTAGVATFTGAVIGGALTINGVGGTLNLGTALTHTFTGAITLTNGTISGNTSDVASSSFSSSNSNTRTVSLGTGTWSLTGTGTVWDTATVTNLTVTPGTSTIKITDSSASAKTFAGGGKTYNNIWFAPSAGTGAYTISGNNTFNDFKDDGTGAHTINFTAGSTTTITTLTLDTNASQPITLQSTTPYSQWNLVDVLGTNTVSYISLADSCASGGATWNAEDGTNVDGGNNCGWVFPDYPSRYWVGGGSTSDWNATSPTNWSISSGGANNASIPDSTKDVFFDASGNSASTISANISVKTLDMTGYTNTLTHNSGVTITVVGNTYKLSDVMTYTLGNSETSATTFTSTTGTEGTPTEINTNGKTLGNTTINGSGGYFRLINNLSAASLTVTAGTLDTNNRSMTVTGDVTNGGSIVANTPSFVSYSVPITFDYTKVPNTDQTDFPVLVTGVYNGTGGNPDLRSTSNGGKVRNSNGYDIEFYSDAGLTTKLKSEKVKYIATTGEIIFWVKIPTLSHTTNTVIYMAYGNPSIISDQSDPESVWTNGYLSVWHLGDGTTLDLNDSTSNNNTLVNGNSTPATPGKFYGGADFVGANSNYLYGGSTIHNGTDATFSFWMNTSSAPDAGTNPTLMTLANGVGSNTYDRFLFINENSNKIRSYIYNTGGPYAQYTNVPATPTPLSEWVYIVYSTKGGYGYPGDSYQKVIENGNVVSYSPYGSSGGFYSAPNIYIGSTIAQTWSRYFNGKMSEPRVASVARSEDWILTEYNNQNSPSTFYSIGSVSASNFSSSYTVGGNWTNTGSITPGTANVILTNSSGNGLTFAGGGAIYNNVWFNRGISTGSITISGNNTFNDFKDTGTEAHSILFTTGSTNNFSSWSVSGSAGKLITINSTTTGTHNLVMSSSGSAISDYLNIQHSNATPSSRWFAGNNSVNNQLVTTAGSGWIFYSKTIYMGIGGTAGGEINNGVTGTGAAATAILTANVVTSVNVTSAGTNYNSTVISFCGGGGSGATGFAVLNSGSVASVTVSSGGSNYTTAPSILFGGMCGGGSGGGGDSEGGSGGGEGQGGGGGGGGGDLGFIFPKWHLAYIASPFLMMLFTLLG